MRAAGFEAPMIPRQLDAGPAPLSSPQERLFLLDRMMPGLAAYNVPTLVRVPTTLDAELLRTALNAIVARHEILRTSIRLIDGAPVQEVSPSAEVQLTIADLRSRPESERDEEAQRVLGEIACRSFDLESDVLLRVALVHVDEHEDLLLVVFHHLASDHASSALLFAELDELYRSLRDGAEPSLPDLPIQYGDYARWQRERLEGDHLDELVDYWSERLAGAPARLELPADRPRPSVQSHGGRLCEFELTPAEAAPLGDLARSHGASLFMVLLAAFKTLLHRHTGVEDMVIGSPVSGRQHEETASLLGYFSNTLALRTDLSGDPTFAELLERVKTTTLEARAHQELPFEKLVEVLNPERNQSHSPIFQVLLGFDIAPDAPTLAGRHARAAAGAGLAVVALRPVDHPARARGRLAARPARVRDRPVRREHDRAPDRPLPHGARRGGTRPRAAALRAAAPDGAERALMLVDWNATDRDHDRRCLHEQFAEQAARRPDAIAIQTEHERIAYGELARRSNQLARELLERGVSDGALVAICLERSVDLLVAMLGTLQVGAAYVPIEPTYPPQRQERIVADANAPVLITQERYLGTIDTPEASVLCVDRDRAQLDVHPDDPLDIAVSPDALAYVIYTSGSTGEPKGVEIRHRSVANLIAEMRERPGLGEDDVLANLTTPAFDLSVPDWYLPLTTGARLAIVPREATLDGVDLADWLARTGATIVQATPTTWQMLVDAGWKGSEQLKIVCGGEALPRALAEELLTRGASAVAHVRADGDDRVVLDRRAPPRRGRPAARRPDREHEVLRAGRRATAGADRRPRRALHRRRRRRARLPQPSRADGREVRRGPVRVRQRGAAVSHRRSRPLA